MTFPKKIDRNLSFLEYLSKKVNMVQNTKKVQKLGFLSIFWEKVTSMTPFKIGFYIEYIESIF